MLAFRKIIDDETINELDRSSTGGLEVEHDYREGTGRSAKIVCGYVEQIH
jgi:hypothetical protein